MKEPKYDVMIVVKDEVKNCQAVVHPMKGATMNQAFKEAKQQANFVNYLLSFQAGKPKVKSVVIKFKRID